MYRGLKDINLYLLIYMYLKWRIKMDINRTNVFLVIMMLVAFAFAMGFANAQPVDYEKLLSAISTVESNGRDDAIGDNGNAVGRYQLWEIYVDDVNRLIGDRRFAYQDRKDPACSKIIVLCYLQHYGALYQKRTGKVATEEVLARIHNGGPRGYAKTATKVYWSKIQKHLK